MPNLKLIAAAACVIGFVLLIGKTYSVGYESGRNSEVVAQKVKTDKLRKDMLTSFNLDLNQANAHASKWRNEAIATKAKLKIKPIEVIKYVDKIKNTSDCVFLGPDFKRMYNNTAEQFSERKTSF